VIPPVVSLTSIPEAQECQEASPMSGNRYFACGAPAEAIIDNGDERPYYMCLPCAMHNLRNRGASVIYTEDFGLLQLMIAGSVKVKRSS
jgi:hypothetical protein